MTQIDANSTCKAVVFDAAGFRFALPLDAISRIVHRAILQEDPNVADLLYFEHEPLEVIDLAQLLSQASGGNKPDFFVVTEAGKRLAIAAEAPPLMMDLPLKAIRNLPSTYHKSLKGLAQQMIILGEAENTSSVLLLDLQQLVKLSVAA